MVRDKLCVYIHEYKHKQLHLRVCRGDKECGTAEHEDLRVTSGRNDGESFPTLNAAD